MTVSPPTEVKEWRIPIEGWTPTPLNKLLQNRWAGARLKKKDARTILESCVICGVPPVGLTHGEKKDRRALGAKDRVPGDPEPRRRHVMLEIRLGKGERACDADAYWKSLLDGLQWAGMLFNDNRQWCSHDAEIKFTRGVDRWDRGSVIVLREVE
jgi:hypothetical protein